MRTACFMLAMVIGAAGNVEARMYQWTNPASGVTQLSGTPPSWYRSAAGGPRVFVFEDGQLVDDSAVTVPEQQRIVLRALAFGVETAAVAVAAPAPPAARPSARAPVSDGAAPPETAGPATETAEETVERLKRVLEAWDQQRAADARAIIEQAPAPGGPASAAATPGVEAAMPGPASVPPR